MIFECLKYFVLRFSALTLKLVVSALMFVMDSLYFFFWLIPLTKSIWTWVVSIHQDVCDFAFLMLQRLSYKADSIQREIEHFYDEYRSTK